MSDHERIWLEPDIGQRERTWCQDDVYSEELMMDGNREKPTEYIRADLYEALRRRNAELEAAASDIAEYAQRYGEYHWKKFYEKEEPAPGGVRELWAKCERIRALLSPAPQEDVDSLSDSEVVQRLSIFGCPPQGKGDRDE